MAIFEKIGEIWTAIIQWIISAITDLSAVFYEAETGFTFIGVLALIGLGIGVVFLNQKTGRFTCECEIESA